MPVPTKLMMATSGVVPIVTYTAKVTPGALFSWGASSAGLSGTNTASVDASSPVQIGSLTNWKQGSGASFGFHMVKSDGTLWGWGQNSAPSWAVIGDGTAVSRSSPVQVGSLTDWSQVQSGSTIAAAIKTDGTLWAWGRQAGHGSVGDGTVINRSSPVQIGSLTTWTSVACAEYATAGISGGKLYTWGNNAAGRLGQGTNNIACSSPIQVGALTTWSSVFGNGECFHAIKTDGTLWGWGQNATGEVGNDKVLARHSSPVQVGTRTDWARLSHGGRGTADPIFAITTKGKMWGWGANSQGGIGDGTQINRSVPVQIGSLNHWHRIGPGQYGAVAVQTNGTLWCWGYNERGKVGDGTVVYRSSPVQIGSLTVWADCVGAKGGSLGIKGSAP